MLLFLNIVFSANPNQSKLNNFKELLKIEDRIMMNHLIQEGYKVTPPNKK